jgi:glycosyltransferase involved in cell wall biosynthesis
MRVALLTNEYPTEGNAFGGLASYLRRLGRALADLGHEAEVFTTSCTTERVRDGSVLVHRTAVPTHWPERMARLPLLWRRAGDAEILLPAWAIARALRRRHRERPFDVIQAANHQAIGLVAAARPVAPVVTRLSSYEPLWRAAQGGRDTEQTRRTDAAELRQLRLSAAVYAPSRLLAERVGAVLGRPVPTLAPPFAMDACDAAPPPAPLTPDGYALFFGTIGRMKGCDRLARALARALPRCPGMTFVFVGRAVRIEGGAHYDALIARELGPLRDRVMVWPARSAADLMPIVAGARLIALPSRIDNLPNACLEAMAHGRVVVATRGASFEELIEDGVSGCLTPQDDDGALAEAIARIWAMPREVRRRMGEAARRRVADLSPARTLPPLLEILTGVTGKPRAGHPLRSLLRVFRD